MDCLQWACRQFTQRASRKSRVCGLCIQNRQKQQQEQERTHVKLLSFASKLSPKKAAPECIWVWERSAHLGRREQIGVLLEPPKDELKLVVRLVVRRLKGDESMCLCAFLNKIDSWMDRWWWREREGGGLIDRQIDSKGPHTTGVSGVWADAYNKEDKNRAIYL